jgi:hypothetical protein
MKTGDLLIVFSVQGTGGIPTGPDPGNSIGDQDIGSPGIDSLVLWKIMNEEDAVFDRKKSRQELFQQIFALRIFGVG